MMIFISAPYVCHGGRAVQKRRPGSAPRMSVGGPEKARRNFFISAYVVGCGAPLREGKFFISERVAWDMGRGARKNNPRRCVWVRPGARACLQAWRGVAWRYVACLGFLGFRVQARHGKLHAQLAAACMHAHRARTHAVRGGARPAARRGLGTSDTGTAVNTGASRFAVRNARSSLLVVCRAVRLSQLSDAPASGSCDSQIRSVLGPRVGGWGHSGRAKLLCCA